MLGSFVSGLPMVRFGQRVTLMYALPLSLISWITLATAPNFWLLILARFFQGFDSSFMSVSSTTYVAELTHSTVRGQMAASLDLTRQIGGLFVYALGSSSLTWRQIALTCGLVNTIPTFLGLIRLPDSPRWLATRGRNDQAYKSLVYFRGPKYNCHKELADITEQLEVTVATNKRISDQLRLLRKPYILRFLIIMTAMFSICHFNGLGVLRAYLVVILDAAEMDINSYLCAVIIGVIRVIGTGLYVIVIDRVNRKPLLAVPTLIVAVCMALLGIYFFDQSRGGYLRGHDWLPLTCLAVHALLAQNPVVNILRSEVFPTSVRSIVVPILFTMFFSGGFVALLTYPYIQAALGDSGAFWLFSATNVLVVVIVVAGLPETRGKTLEQITESQRRCTEPQQDLQSSDADFPRPGNVQ